LTHYKNNKFLELQLRRGKSRRDFFEYQYEGAEGTLEQMRKFTDVNEKQILDLGCGYGGGSAYLACNGLKITAVDNHQYDKKFLKDAITFANKKGAEARFCQADAHHLPFKDDIFDIIRLDSVFEHLKEPEIALSECRRVLKSGGLLFISFPLFYSPYGGHIDDYIKIPWFHVLPDKFVCRIIRRRKSKPGLVTTSYVERLYLSLNKMSLKKYKRLVRKCAFKELHFEETYFMPHDISLFINHLKKALADRSLTQTRKTFTYFNLASFVEFIFLYFLYRLPAPLKRRWREFITSGIRAVLS